MTIVKALEEYCMPRCNETFERYVLRSRQQLEGEPFKQFLRDIQLKAQTCNFGELKDSMVRDQIVCRIVDKKLRARLLQEKDLTLESAVEICVWSCPSSKQTSTPLKSKVSTDFPKGIRKNIGRCVLNLST